MKHPNQATLALLAGGDLGPFTRWRTSRHLAKCDRCRDVMAEFEAVRETLPQLAGTPEVAWNRLAGEMKANIRLGLAAGECVRVEERPVEAPRLFAGARAAVAFASVVALVVTGLVLERPAPLPDLAALQGIEVQSTGNGVQVQGSRGAMRLLNSGAPSDAAVQIGGRIHYVPAVTYTTGAQGEMKAHYVDSDTGYVTVTSVYAN